LSILLAEDELVENAIMDGLEATKILKGKFSEPINKVNLLETIIKYGKIIQLSPE
jgi:hypothetical protein